MIQRALISVFDKTGLDELVGGLADLGVELVASRGSSAYISELGIPVTPVVSTPAARASSIARTPGNSGRSEGWTLTIRLGKRSRKAVVSRCM